jgi:hypothetical protein
VSSHLSYDPVVSLRVLVDLAIEIQRAIDQRNAHRSGPPWTRTSFLLIAAREKLAVLPAAGARPPHPPPPPPLPDVIVDQEPPTHPSGESGGLIP